MSGWMQSLRALARLKPTQKLTRDYLVSLLTAVLLALAVGAAIMLVCSLAVALVCVRHEGRVVDRLLRALLQRGAGTAAGPL